MHKSRGEMLKENFGAIKWTLKKFFGRLTACCVREES